MTEWRDYHVDAAANSGAPPVGAPEDHPANQVNNIAREMMSVIRQLGDEFEGAIDGLGTMALQDADAVAITGGTIVGAAVGGNGSGLTNIKAQALIEGPIPSTVFPGDTTPLNAKVQRAVTADNLAGTNAALPVGTIVMWYGTAATVPAGWKICNGTGGTPDLRGRFIAGAFDDAEMHSVGGALSATVSTTANGAHNHFGATGPHALTVAELPSHAHAQMMGSGSDGGPFKEIQGGPKSALAGMGQDTGVVGGNAGHDHAIGTQADHGHSVTVPTVPPYHTIYFIMRTS